MFIKSFCVLVLWTKVASVLEGFSMTSVVRTEDAFENNLRIRHEFTKYLKGRCGLGPDRHFSFKGF